MSYTRDFCNHACMYAQLTQQLTSYFKRQDCYFGHMHAYNNIKA